jgi:hypothetical protein
MTTIVEDVFLLLLDRYEELLDLAAAGFPVGERLAAVQALLLSRARPPHQEDPVDNPDTDLQRKGFLQ